jgi:hypothetical protein
MYRVTRKNGSFKGRKRYMVFDSYDAARTFLRSYLRTLFGRWKRSDHPNLFLAKCAGLTIQKM